MSASSFRERAQKVLAPVYAVQTYHQIVRSEGALVFNAEGRRLLDFTTGIAVMNLGHSHPKVIAAAKKQLDEVFHCAGNYLTESIIQAAEKLTATTPGNLKQLFFSNSGAESVEAALKMARYVSGRKGYIAFKGGFGGRTLGATSVTGSTVKHRSRYEPLIPMVYFADYPYPYRSPFGPDPVKVTDDVMRQLESIFCHLIPAHDVAAIIVEPVTGEGGYVVAPMDFLPRLQELCTREGILLIVDEVQTGFGRTGKMWACEYSGVVPDILTTAKGIANGLPLSATISTPELMAKWDRGTHGSTFGGNAVACAACIAVLDAMKEEKVLEQVQSSHEYTLARLKAMQERFEVIGDVRGLGLMMAIELVKDRETKEPAADVTLRTVEKGRELGLLSLPSGPTQNIIRLIPPLNIAHEHLEEGLDILEKSLAASL